MLFRSIVIGLFLLSNVTLAAGAAFAADNEKQEEYREYLDRIESLKKSTGLDKFEALAEEIESKHDQWDFSSYTHVTAMFCRKLASSVHGNDKGLRAQLLVKCATRTLERINAAVTDSDLVFWDVLYDETRLLVGLFRGDRLMNREDMVDENEHPKLRTAITELILRAWKRQQDHIDEDWDPNAEPLKNIRPPASTGLPAGVAPEAVKDPELRAEYEAALERNRQRTREFNMQRFLRMAKKHLWGRVEEHLVQTYSRPPYNVEELKMYLQKYVADKEAQKKTLQEEEYREYVDRIKSMERSTDLKALEALAEEIESKHDRWSIRSYAYVMSEFCGMLSSTIRADDEGLRARLLVKCATRTLERINAAVTDSDIPVLDLFNNENKLLKRLFDGDIVMYRKGMVDKNEYPKLRTARTELILRAWKRQQDHVDGDSERAREVNMQYFLSTQQKSYWPKVEKHLVRTYSRPPYNVEELKTYLQKYVADEEAQTRILQKVNEPIPGTKDPENPRDGQLPQKTPSLPENVPATK